MNEDQLWPMNVCYDDGRLSSNQVYLRIHKPLESSEGDSRAVFVAGLPLRLSQEQAFQSVFSPFGAVQSVVIHSSKLSAVVIFETLEGIQRLRQAQVQALPLVAKCNATRHVDTLKDWMTQHKAKSPGNEALQYQLNQWIESYEQKEQAAVSEAARDSEWTVVERKKGSLHKNRDPERAIASGGLSKTVAETKYKRSLVKLQSDFYPHQKWHKQTSDLSLLKAKFEEDKKKVVAMKAARRFRPA